MLYFESDYTEGAHETVLKALLETNLESLSGYGNDKYCQQAKQKLKEACQCPEAEVFFLVGGTQTNQIVINSLLKQYEGVVAASTGHVSVHEAGAIEWTGHKVLELPHQEGKLQAATLKAYLQEFYADPSYDHMVFPGMVYISYPTEFGTLYSKQELADLSSVCREYELPLYLDGARLGYGLISAACDLSLPDLANYCDVFYIGGTKVGALFGEAVVFTKHNAPKNFTTMIKQHGALLAKGRFLGIQFDTLFTDDLYFTISKHAIDLADMLKKGLQEKGYPFYLDSPTNQQFILVDADRMEALKQKLAFTLWGKAEDGRFIIRLVTSWATRKEAVEELLALL